MLNPIPLTGKSLGKEILVKLLRVATFIWSGMASGAQSHTRHAV
jgi:hypothetical protein